jgi:hypothetical protein
MAQIFDQDPQIFDQEQPKSALARSLNAAFAGCEVWTVAPPKRRLATAPAVTKGPGLTAPPRWPTA